MILCLDLETTGLDEQRCGLVEIGATWLHNGDTFFRSCRPPSLALIEPQALAVNGRTEESCRSLDFLPEALAVTEFVGWVRGSEVVPNTKVQIAAWNAQFDHRHLCAAMTRASIDHRYRPFSHRLIDAHSILAADEMRKKLSEAHRVYPLPLHILGNEVANCDEASKILGLPEEAKPHNALAGAKQVRAMLRRLLGDIGALP